MRILSVALVLIIGLAVPPSSAPGQDHFSAQISAGLIAPLGTSAVRPGIEGESSPGLALTGAVARRLTRGLDVRLGLLLGLGSEVTVRYDEEACAAARQGRPQESCQSEEPETLIHLFVGPSYRIGQVTVGVDIGARAQGWTTACILIDVLCISRGDYLGVSPAVHPHVGMMLSPWGRNLRLELGSFLGSDSGQKRTDLSFSMGIVL
jgi:hypothetical protein